LKIIIAGLGSVGKELAEQLIKEKHTVSAIETDTRTFLRAKESFDIRVVNGNAASETAQKDAGIADCDLFIGVTANDEINILCSIIAKKLGAKETVARIRNPEYFSLFTGGELGLNLIVNPEQEAARYISQILKHPLANSIEPFFDGDGSIIEVTLGADSPLINKRLLELPQISKLRFLVCAVKRAGEAYIPNGAFELLEGDKIHIAIAQNDVLPLVKELGLQRKARKVMILGGGRATYYLTKSLRAMGIGVKIIEKDYSRCVTLSIEFPRGVEVIEGLFSETELLLDEGLLTCDAFIPLTSDDGQNVLLSLFAAARGAKKVITRIDNDSYLRILENGGVHSVLSLNVLTANKIIKYVRERTGTEGGRIMKYYRIINDDSAILEFSADKNFRALGKPLKHISFADGVLVAGVLRGGVFFIPRGNDTIEVGDGILIAASTEKTIDDLNDILQ
jgi:trk system potassium uptake protein TrkA